MSLLLLALAPGCKHSWPFSPVQPTATAPLSSTPPVQITFNPGTDRTPAWSSGGAEIVYSAEQLDRRDRDRCLGVLPGGGGQQRSLTCGTGAHASDSTDAFEEPSVGPNGALLYLRASNPIGLGSIAPTSVALERATLDHPEAASVVLSLPYPAASGRSHDALTHLTWLDGSTVVYLAQEVGYQGSDTVRTGIELARLRLDSGGPPAILPWSDNFSSYDLAGTDTMYYSINGDSRVYRRVLSSGATTVVYDYGMNVPFDHPSFGAEGIVRDVHVAGSHLVAIVAGDILYETPSPGERIQRDRGGDLHLLDLTTGADVIWQFTGSLDYRWFRRPILAADGHHVLVEGYPVQITRHTDEAGTLLSSDTLLSRSADLWLLDIP